MLRIEVKRDRTQCFIVLYGSLDDKAWDDWTDCLVRLSAADGVQSFVFGCYPLRYISSQAAGAWLEFILEQQNHGNTCHIASPQAQIHEALLDMGFYALTGLSRERKEIFGLTRQSHT
jgi:anti-anti-sigma regulatory factor